MGSLDDLDESSRDVVEIHSHGSSRLLIPGARAYVHTGIILSETTMKPNDMPLIDWFTSDMHYWHKNILKYADRPFSTIEDMNEALIERHNAVVTPHDFVLVVGDCFFGSYDLAKGIMDRLNGRKGLVRGNHDRSARKMLELGFEFVVDELMINIAGKPVRVNHLPYWNDGRRGDERYDDRFKKLRPQRVRGEALIHGHTHTDQQRDGNMIHVGVDAWGYYPVRMKDVRQLVQSI